MLKKSLLIISNSPYNDIYHIYLEPRFNKIVDSSRYIAQPKANSTMN